jgi:hypothetical protein
MKQRESLRSGVVCQAPTPYTAGIKTMNALEVSKRAIDACKRHDADALVALYAEGHRFYWRLSIYVCEGDDWKIRLSALAEHPRNIAF